MDYEIRHPKAYRTFMKEVQSAEERLASIPTPSQEFLFGKTARPMKKKPKPGKGKPD